MVLINSEKGPASVHLPEENKVGGEFESGGKAKRILALDKGGASLRMICRRKRKYEPGGRKLLNDEARKKACHIDVVERKKDVAVGRPAKRGEKGGGESEKEKRLWARMGEA